jgi:hypothetical protein
MGRRAMPDGVKKSTGYTVLRDHVIVIKPMMAGATRLTCGRPRPFILSISTTRDCARNCASPLKLWGLPWREASQTTTCWLKRSLKGYPQVCTSGRAGTNGRCHDLARLQGVVGLRPSSRSMSTRGGTQYKPELSKKPSVTESSCLR